MKRKLISIGIPCYNEEENVLDVYTTLKKIIQKIEKYDFEYIFVDNGSLDKTRVKIQQLVGKNHSVRGVYLSRNFGPEASSQASFDFSKGDAVIWYPCDLQEPAELIPKFIKKWEEGFDSVMGVYTKLQDTWLMAFFRKSFYSIMKTISNIDIPPNSIGYGLYSRRVVEAMNRLPETYRFSRGIRAWVGFKTAFIPYKRGRRLHGKSSYNFFSYLNHAERSFFGFSYIPLDFLIYLGFVLTLLSFFFILGYLLVFLVFRISIKESAIIILAIVLFGSVNLLALSVIGKYVQVIVEETKGRPTYIVEKIEGADV